MADKSWPVWAVVFSPDGRWIAAGRGYRDNEEYWPAGGDGKIVVWRLGDWKRQSGFSAPFTYVAATASFTPDGKNLLAAADKYTRVDPEYHNRLRRQGLAGAPNPWDGHTVFAWTIPDGALVQELHVKANFGCVNSLAISPDGDLLALDRGSGVSVLRRKTGESLWASDGVSHGVDFSPDGKALASVTQIKPFARLFVAPTGEKLTDFDSPDAEVSSTCLRYSPDGKQVAVGASDGSVRLLAADLTKQLRSLAASDEREKVVAVTFAAKAHLMATATRNEVRLFDPRSGERLQAWGGTDRRINAVALSPDGKLLAVGHGDDYSGGGREPSGFVNVWDTTTGRLVKKLD